ncbi:uncharacterized protein C8orf48 homolog isoform X2 [Sceloporus undulatus]|uniref:uncharacterized protein C8orf48 homolog isoform X2 n=1 Tax=Sceloporus undulatus TaxID=8520 RepID=UPI001C4B4EB5|nr:uncharacterized protein C8orf48 homolog isoform X2 [Sceloporus undulatus]
MAPWTYLQEQMELSWNQSNSVPDYSDDTFTSFSEEETCRDYDNDPFVSYSSGEDSKWPAESDLSESTWQSLNPNDKVEKVEFLDLTAAEEQLTNRWISLLNTNRTTAAVARSAVKPPNGAAPTRIPEGSEEGLGALRSFCATKINRICHPPTLAPKKRNKHHDQRHGRTSEKPLMSDVNCFALDQLVNRLHLRNIKETMKQLAEMEIHQPSRCPHCTKKKAELAKSAFLRRRKALMEGALLQEKLEEQMYTRDPLTLIGEIHQTLPKLSEDPRNVWQELNKRAVQGKCDAS